MVAKKIPDPPDLWALLVGIIMVLLPFGTTGQTFFYAGSGIGPVLYQWLLFLTVPLSFFGVGFLNEYFQKNVSRQDGFSASEKAAKYGFQYIVFMSFTILPILLGSAQEDASKMRENAKAIIDAVLRDRGVYIDDRSREILKRYVWDISQGAPSSDAASSLAKYEVFDPAQSMLREADQLILDNPNGVLLGSLLICFELLFVWLLLVGVGFLAERAQSYDGQSFQAIGSKSVTIPSDLRESVPPYKCSSTVKTDRGHRCRAVFGFIVGAGVGFSLTRRSK
ncbi:hypothetical protein [Arcanobacterium phocae]|uniref:hypothetical protein n=1 Tax=Arcanobacterium phocae TaxID=131112 RepID=UPI001C0EE6A7|nr:hypothetical protein [Arcanobacterium phocae]